LNEIEFALQLGGLIEEIICPIPDEHTNMARRRILVIVCTVLFTVQIAQTCPTNQTLLALCRCEDSNNGIILDCSNQDARVTKPVLLDNQVQVM
jgi:hypothetical protein